MTHSSLAAIERTIDKKLANEGEPFAIFDFDNTCIVNDISEATFAYLCSRKLLRDPNLLGKEQHVGDYHECVFRTYHSLLEKGRLKAAYVLIARMFSGFTSGEAEAVTLTAISEEGSRIGSKMLYGIHIERGLARRPNVLSLMQYVREKGVRVWIVSASPEVSVRAAMRYFGIKAELIGVRSVIKDGVCTAVLEEPLSMFEGKVVCIRKYITSEHVPLLAAGDSESDLPMLEVADIKVVIDRGNELTRIAREQKWFLLQE